ncbi:VOC family protein [Aliihoeflea aestuarii]|jgi:catechol 2,3-dioxygenase-like lactoylglutathione lyase family enzyme|uniref:bleomycin resistance protein n=1 Tax=Aliihoeflea aestuarii TaxID=453840 RepID=UPI0020921852|nr:VOC family protein [Aliihoeflea aestuarii]MCO6390488.1 VOC family protein [Aliihoeflea aestuarii]
MRDLEETARAIPILPSLDIARTRRFYEEKLGFSGEHYEDEDYLIVTRGEIELHFWRTDDEKLPPVSSAYIRGRDVLALHADFTARGAEKISEVMSRDWGMTEFYVWDPDGNLLRIGLPTECFA